jgi:glutamate/tyrosine decarboxylase-like PLP-dependent enzyme
VLGYFAGLLYNPNNVSGESAPITMALELEVGRMVSGMLGYNPNRAWAHICSGGTLATLEALWVARAVQFAPLIAREYCRDHSVSFGIRLANGTRATLTDADDRSLLSLRPQEASTVLRALAYHLETERHLTTAEALGEVNRAVATSRYSVAYRGLGSILASTGLRPVVLASAAAHYSIPKACNVLGYGEEAARLIAVNDRFQIDVGALRSAIRDLAPTEYIAAVIGIVGTTEEGAVDPIHRILSLREECERAFNRSFWLHVDAAWGGYVRSLFSGVAVPREARESGLDAVCEAYINALAVSERFDLDVGADRPDVRTIDVRWDDADTYAAILAVADGDSTTVDPHKMGYVPYPAGVVAFRNGGVTELVTQRAQYLSEQPSGIGSFTDPGQWEAFGPHILEGSKPGAAALSCWLAHRTIPLTAEGHGKIVRVTLLNARRLAQLLKHHHLLFRRLERERAPEAPAPTPFTFFPVTEPESNLVCFVVRPMAWRDGAMELCPVPLAEINRLNQRVYSAASIPGSRSHRLSAAQPFFVSRTRFEEQQYQGRTLRHLLERLGVSEEQYRQEGLFVLRSTVMNPWHSEARQAGMDYLYEFIRFLHRVAAESLG